MIIDDPDAPTEQTVTVHRRPSAPGNASGRALDAAVAAGSFDLRGAFEQSAKLMNADRDEEAAALLRRVVATDPLFAAAWTNLGVANRKLKAYRLAIACYRRSLEIAPEIAGTWSNLANAYKDMERFEESIACHKRALALDAKPGPRSEERRVGKECRL